MAAKQGQPVQSRCGRQLSARSSAPPTTGPGESLLCAPKTGSVAGTMGTPPPNNSQAPADAPATTIKASTPRATARTATGSTTRPRGDSTGVCRDDNSGVRAAWEAEMEGVHGRTLPADEVDRDHLGYGWKPGPLPARRQGRVKRLITSVGLSIRFRLGTSNDSRVSASAHLQP